MSRPQPDSVGHDMAHNSAHLFAKSAKRWGSLAVNAVLEIDVFDHFRKLKEVGDSPKIPIGQLVLLHLPYL